MRQDYSDRQKRMKNIYIKKTTQTQRTLIRFKESTKLCVGNLQQVYSDLGHNFPVCNININSRECLAIFI